MGKEVLKQDLQVGKELIETITPDLIKSGAWKGKKFRRYDITSSIPKTSGGKKLLKEETENSLKALTRLGFNLKYDQNIISQLVELLIEQKDCCGNKEIEDSVSKLEDLDLFTKQNVQEYASILLMSDEELASRNEIRKKFNELLKSLLVK